MNETVDSPCAEVRRRLAAYFDEELPVEESSRIHAHLEGCPPCGQRAGLERGFTRLLRERLGRDTAPDALPQQIRRDLAREASAPAQPRGISSWRPALALPGYALAAVFLALWLAGPDVQLKRSWRGAAEAPPESKSDAAMGASSSALALETEPILLRGVIVCALCEKYGMPIERQRRCAAYGHFNGVRDEQGRLWYVVEGEGGGGVLSDGRLRGRALVVDGEAIGKLNYLLPKSVQLL